jgi:hypothetical protein
VTGLHAKIFKNIEAEIGITKIAEYKNKEHYQKIGFYMNKYDDKWERIQMKHKKEVEIHLYY